MTALSRKRGDTYADEFVFKSATTGLPLNVTGYTFYLTVNSDKTPVDTTNQKYQLTGTILDAANGRVEFAPSAVQADLVGNYFYEVQMTDTNSRKRTILSDKYIYTQDITKN